MKLLTIAPIFFLFNASQAKMRDVDLCCCRQQQFLHLKKKMSRKIKRNIISSLSSFSYAHGGDESGS